MQKRLHYLDILKFIAIFSVCFYHFSYIAVDLSQGFSCGVLLNRWLFTLNSICVPVFMMVNGALLLNRPLDIKKHYRNLAIFFAVYWVWRAVTFALLGSARGYDFSALGIGGFISHFVLMQDFGSPLLVDHFWFIIVYIRIQLILPLLHCLFSMKKEDFRMSAAVAMTVLWVSCFAVKDYSLIRFLLPASVSDLFFYSLAEYSPFTEIYGTMIFFFLLGGILVRCADRLKKAGIIVYVAAFAAASAVQTVMYVVEHINTGSGGDLVFGKYNTTTNIVMCISIFMIAYCCENVFERFSKISAPFESVGQNTITVFYLHWIFGQLILPALNIPEGYISSAAAVAAIVFISTSISVICRRIPVVQYLFGVVPPQKNL